MALTNPSDSDVARWRLSTDEELLRECEIQSFRGSGPGGQKRNKSSSGVRVVHEPSGCVGFATERRSKQQNLEEALARLRLEMAFELRSQQPVETLTPVGPNHRDFARHVGELLDALYQNLMSVRDAAGVCSTTTGQLMQMICSDARVLARVNDMRRKRGLKPLRDHD